MKINRGEKLIVLLNCTVPVALLGYDALRGQLGANPVNFAIRTTGMLALVFLLLSLTVTPVARISGWNWLVLFRRTFGLYAFFHASLHLGIFFVYDRELSVRSTLAEMALRPYLVVGSAALFLMVPLAITSTNGMIRRLGPKRWKLLHRLAYLSAILGVTHYYMLVKADLSQPIAFAIALAVLLGFRVVYSAIHRWRTRGATGTGGAVAPRVAEVPIAATPLATPRSRKFWTGQLRVAAIFEETHNVRTFRLASTDGSVLPFDFVAGQYLNLSLDVAGKKVNRSYTIASSPTQVAHCEITVKRDGVGSTFLHDNLKEGLLLNVAAPAGRFTFTGTGSTSVVMIAAGVGITPLMTKIRYLTDISWPGDIYLSYSVRTERDIIFNDELEYLQRRHPNLHVLLMVTRAEGQTWSGLQGRLTAERLLRHAPCLRDSAVHICGPDAMLEPTKQMLREIGVPDERIRFESFASPNRAGADDAAPALADAGVVTAPVMASASGRSATVTFARSNREATVAPDESILEASERAGVNIDFDCRSGICGQCKTKLLTGVVQMATQDALSSKDVAGGYILACQARCTGPVTVDA